MLPTFDGAQDGPELAEGLATSNGAIATRKLGNENAGDDETVISPAFVDTIEIPSALRRALTPRRFQTQRF